jgi:adenylate cyclase class IV
MQSYEVEIKSLLGDPEQAEALRKRMKEIDPQTQLVSRNRQLNHYFMGGNLEMLATIMNDQLSSEAREKLADLISRVQEFSVRTRDKDGAVFLVAKASVSDDTSANGVARIEFEEKVPLTLEKLDALVQAAGFTYQAKWSREREEYLCKETNVCLDRNAGYGWLAEFERVVTDEAHVESARMAVEALMQECGVAELPQERLERMFTFYNAHWPEYYGTENIFTIE